MCTYEKKTGSQSKYCNAFSNGQYYSNKTTLLIHLIRVDWLMCEVIVNEVNSCKPYVNVIPYFKLVSCIL